MSPPYKMISIDASDSNKQPSGSPPALTGSLLCPMWYRPTGANLFDDGWVTAEYLARWPPQWVAKVSLRLRGPEHRARKTISEPSVLNLWRVSHNMHNLTGMRSPHMCQCAETCRRNLWRMGNDLLTIFFFQMRIFLKDRFVLLLKFYWS